MKNGSSKFSLTLLCGALFAGAHAQDPGDITAPLGGTTGLNTLYGPTGLLKIPTAFTVREDYWRFGATFAKGLRGPTINYGPVSYIEVGGAYLDTDDGDDEAIGNAKLLILPRNIPWLSIGVGVIDVADSVDQTFYVVGSADLIPPPVESPTDATAVGLRVHLGVGNGLFQEKVFGGGELIFSDNFSIVGEWDSENVNAGIRYKYRDFFIAQVGTFDKRLSFQMTTAIRF
jgi:hypothetical protein